MKQRIFLLLVSFNLVLAFLFSFSLSTVYAQNCVGGGVGGCTGTSNPSPNVTGNPPPSTTGNPSPNTTGNPPAGYKPLTNPIKASTIQEFIKLVLDIVVKVGAPIILFFLIYVGFLFATARGNENQLTTAKRALVYTLIGGLIILGAQALSSIIQNTIDQIWHG